GTVRRDRERPRRHEVQRILRARRCAGGPRGAARPGRAAGRDRRVVLRTCGEDQAEGGNSGDEPPHLRTPWIDAERPRSSRPRASLAHAFRSAAAGRTLPYFLGSHEKNRAASARPTSPHTAITRTSLHSNVNGPP